MKKITKEEFESKVNDSRNPVIQEIMKLETGEGLEINFDEWNLKTSPAGRIHNLAKMQTPPKKFKVSVRNVDRIYLILRES